jgi:hypothetical protein
VQIGVARGPAALSIIIPLLEPAPLAERSDSLGHDGILVDPFASRDPIPAHSMWEGRTLPLAESSGPAGTGKSPSLVDPSRRDVDSAQRTVGWVLGGAGLAVFTAGLVLGFEAMATRDDISSVCPNTFCSAAQASEWHDRFVSQARASTALIGLGVTSLAAGVVVYIMAAPSAPVPRGGDSGTLHLAPAVGAGSAGLVAAGAFQ